MAETTDGDTVSAYGSARYDRVDCERFTVAGTATVSDGVVADEVSVDGSVDVGGTLEGDVVDLDGSATVDGHVRAGRLAVDGSGAFGGDVSVDHLDADGSTTVAGNLDGHEIAGDGSTDVGGNLVAHEASFDGSVTVGGLVDVTHLAVDGPGTFGDVTAEEIVVDGALGARQISADTFEFTVRDDSEADAVDGGDVTVRGSERSRSPGCGHPSREEPAFDVDTVEGETVDLDATRAGIVVGESVRLGPDAEVDVVYTDDLDADDDATVGDVRPYGDY